MIRCTKCKVDTPEEFMVSGSCWCKQCSKEYTARFRRTERGRAYTVYNGMLARCYDSKSSRYLKYGGAGVVVSSEWLGEEGFNAFFDWYCTQPIIQDKSLQLDKDVICNANGIKPHKYSPDTCKFITRKENQRNYSKLLANNTSGYTGVTKSTSSDTWGFRLHREHTGNINRSRFSSALEAAKAREAFIIINELDFKLEHVGTTLDLDEAPSDPYTYFRSSNYSMIRKLPQSGKFSGTVNLLNGKRKSIGTYLTEREASEAYTSLVNKLNIKKLNKPSHLFGFGPLIKEP